MKAVRLHQALDLRVEEVSSPSSPPAGFVNLEVRAAGICGSDLHNYCTGEWISRSPSTAGHEFCGRVSEVGKGVNGFAAGDLVSVDSRVTCGTCPACTSGLSNVCESMGFVGEACDGGFAQMVQLPASLLVHHERDLSPRIAAMAEPLAVALHAVRRLALPAGEPVLVVGCGAIGGLSALVLSHLHNGPLLLADLNAEKCALVSQATGGKTVALDETQISKALADKRLRYALDTTGNVIAIEKTLGLLAGGGALGLVGIGHGTLALDPKKLVEAETSLIGCHAYTDELPEAVRMLPSMAPVLERFCQVLSSLDDIPKAYNALLAGEGKTLKTIIEIEE
ncbi:zinc-binding dehydrogenase [Hoeflea sp.]|uniref:zinc-dependent alcohol dehydrogenase n=1 Tax=Hoeflea sp. TaxID=1940281 RepID=UPI003747D0A7